MESMQIKITSLIKFALNKNEIQAVLANIIIYHMSLRWPIRSWFPFSGPLSHPQPLIFFSREYTKTKFSSASLFPSDAAAWKMMRAARRETGHVAVSPGDFPEEDENVNAK